MHDATYHVLTVGDEVPHAQEAAIARSSQAVRPELELCPDLAEGLQRLDNGDVDVVILDLHAAADAPLDNFSRVRRQFPDIPVVVMAGVEEMELATEAMRRGAADCLLRGQDGGILDRVVRYAVTSHRAERALRQSERRYRRLLQAVTSYLYQVDIEDGRALATKHGAGCRRFTGYTPGEYAADAFLWSSVSPTQCKRKKWIPSLKPRDRVGPTPCLRYRVGCRFPRM